MEKKKRSLADALYLPGVADIEAEFPRVTIGLKPAQFDADDGEGKKRNIVEALSMPEIADIEVEFPRSRELPRIIDLSDDTESAGDLVGGERLTPYDPADDLTSEEATAVFLDEAEKTGDPAYIARAHEVAERARAKNKAK